MLIDSKHSIYGHIEIRKMSSGWYGLYINGELKEQSADLGFIRREYDKW